jgi:hypothetical protein
MSIDRWTDCLSTEEAGNIEINVAEQAVNAEEERVVERFLHKIEPMF